MTLMIAALSGCNGNASNEGPAPPAAQSATDESEHAGHSHGDADMENVKAELAKLSPEDAASAEKQHFCPVSDELLGTMGPPIKVDVNGTPVWICCKGCRKDLLAEPDKYLAKLRSE